MLFSVFTEIFGLEEVHNNRSWLWASDITKIEVPRFFKVSRGCLFFYIYRNSQLSASSARKDTLLTDDIRHTIMASWLQKK